MSLEQLKSNQPIRGIWWRFRNQIIQEVREDSALCEFDCRHGQCTMEEWESCDRRLNKAAGELMPSPRKTSPRQNRFPSRSENS
jgi:uncharacterized protein YecT (DUF1311 family)